MSSSLQPASGELRLTPQNPWPGLAAFTAANRDFFYGREAEVAEIFRRVRRQMLTVLFGVSGLGKTSLLQAGLLPKLGGTPFHPILIRLDQSAAGEDLIEQVRAAITQEVEVARKLGIKIPRPPEPGEDLWGYFHDKTTDWFNAKEEVVNPVLVFDQFEEIFTREASTRDLEERRQRFMELLACLVENRAPDELRRHLESEADHATRYDFRQDDYRVVISLREDFLAHLEGFKQRMPSVMENRMRLKPLTEEQALQAVLGPGREIVDEPVAREIVAFVAGKARGTQPTTSATTASFETAAPAEADPVLLSLVCDQLNRRRRERQQERITADLLTAEREGIIQEFYEQAFRGLPPKVREWVEDELLTASGYRNRAAQEDALQVGLSPGSLDELVSGRILHREERGGVVWLELTHDLLTGPAVASRKAREQRLQAEAATRREQALKAERDEQQRKARRSAWISRSLAAALVGLMALAWWYWDGYLRVHTEYYATFAKRRGFMEGVGPLTEAQAGHRRVSFRFTYKGRHGQLIRVQAVDARGRLNPRHGVGTYLKYASEDENPERECQWEFIRDARGRVVYEMALNRDTNLVWGFVYSPATTNEFSRRGHFVNPEGMPLAMRNSAAEYIEFTYDTNGFEIKATYQDHLGNPQSGVDGQYGELRQYDTRGLPVRKTSLTAAGQPMVDDAGNSTLELAYNSLGLVTNMKASVITNWQAPARPVLLKAGFHEARLRYDEFGNEMGIDYLDLSGKPVLTRDGYAGITEKYDTQGNLIEWTCFDAGGRPTLDESNQKHRSVMEYDHHGNRTNWIMFDTDGKRRAGTDGFCQVVSRYNERDQEVERTYYDSEGRLTRINGGYTRLERRFDEHGRMIEERYFDEANRPRGGAKRHARRQLTYDERGNLLSEAYFDPADQPVSGANGYARMSCSYDERGNRIEEIYFDEMGHPVQSANGYARIQKRYDERGNVIEESYLDENGSPARLSDGYSRRTMVYDERNNRIEEAYFNEQNQPAPCTEGYARKGMAYDERRNLLEEAYFDATSGAETSRSANEAGTHLGTGDPGVGTTGLARVVRSALSAEQTGGRVRLNGRLVNNNDGYARIVTTFDERDNWIQVQYFQANGALWPRNRGAGIVRAEYDSRRRRIGMSYFDETGKPLNIRKGYARLTRAYDEAGNLTQERYFDVEGQPTVDSANDLHGWVRSFDHRGNWTNWLNLGTDGKPRKSTAGLARAVTIYDQRGNKIQWAAYDENERLIALSENYARSEYRYDDQDNRIEEAYFDAANRPVRASFGYARLTCRYNEHGNRTEESYWDERGKLVELNGGEARTISSFDARGNRTELAYYDAEHRPVLNRNTGFHKWVKSFDSYGRWTNLAYLDIAGRLTTAKEGFAQQVMRYNDRGNLIETTWFDAAGHPVNGTNGYARFVATYDERGKQLERAYYTPTGRPARGPDGFTRYLARYDRQGRRMEASFFYEPGNPIRVTNGYARVTIFYDDRGNQVQWACFDENGQPVPDQTDGMHMLQTSYDDAGRWISKTYFGTSGQMLMTTNGYARLEIKYDPAGNIIEKVYLDELNRPVSSDEFYAREVLRYDAAGRKAESLCYWSPESNFVAKNGYALTRRTYDEGGRLLTWACFDTNGAPTVDLEMGNHAFHKQYDERGYETNALNLDLTGHLVVTSNGYARVTMRRDGKGNEIEALYFDENNQPMHTGTSEYRRTSRYDERNRKTESTFHYQPDSPMVTERGYVQSTISYDANGRATRWACYDAAGHPVTERTVGYHAWTKSYDAWGNVTNQVYFGTDLRRTNSASGYAETRTAYDRRGGLLSWACYGTKGEPVLDLSDGIHRLRKDYDGRGNWTNLANFGVDGALIVSSNGYARALATYDNRDNQTGLVFLDASGRVTLGADGYARVAKQYNERNELTQIEFFDAQDRKLTRRLSIVEVMPGGEGERVGLRAGDVIVSYAGTAVETQPELVRLANQGDAGQRILEVRRADQVLVFEVPRGLLGIVVRVKFE